MKKGELSINMIIVAAIAIVVLVIIIFLLVKNFGNTNDAVDCPSVGGICMTSDRCTEPITLEDKTPTCAGSGDICCKPI